MTPRQHLTAFGRKRGKVYVRVFRETIRGVWVVRVKWTNRQGAVRTVSYEDTRRGIAEAKTFAGTIFDELNAPPEKPAPKPQYEPVMVRELYDRYITANKSNWRDKTLQGKRDKWRLVELVIPAERMAAAVTRETLDALKGYLLETKNSRGKLRSVRQVSGVIEQAAAVFRWGVENDVIPPTKVATYTPKFSKDQKRTQVVTMAEYSSTEREAITNALDPRSVKHWRAWALNVVMAYCGPRQNAARHLEWADIELSETDGRIHWRPELDKMGEDRFQPMPRPVVDAFWVAYGWSLADDYSGPLVFYGVHKKTRDKPYSYGALNAALRGAEARADIAHIDYRAAHGHRRGVAGDVHEKTGSEKSAADWIGDKSVKVVRKHYLLAREAEMKRLAGLVGEDK